MLAACTGAGFAWGSSAVSFVTAMYNKRQLHEQPHEQPDVGFGGAASQHLRSNHVNCPGSRHLGWNRSRLRSRIRTSISLSRCSGGSSPLIMLHKGRMSADVCECGVMMCCSFRHPAFTPPSKRYGATASCVACCTRSTRRHTYGISQQTLAVLKSVRSRDQDSMYVGS